jgi:DNA-binding NarL/FixJ family response regulator
MYRSRSDGVSAFEARPQPVRPALRAVPDPVDGIECLTPREREVLALIASGCSNEGICDTLVVSPKTVESHVHSIFLKLALPRGAAVHPRVLATRAWLHANPTARAA